MKVKKKLWLIGIALLIVVAVLICLAYRFNIIPHSKYGNDNFNIPPYQSAVDRDGDGIDDQTDILQGARAYLDTQPKYKSQYYNGGYPDDGYGVCTDVVAFALKDAGYDLKDLVDEDIRKHPDEYDIEKPDPNIDFRRVRNLKVFFSRSAISLTTDISQIDQWQGGDIVVFEKHIGIVSDTRNKDGVPFILHLSSPYQVRTEEDALSHYKIVGHYRIS